MAKDAEQEGLDEVRRRLVERARAKGMTLADLSRVADRNLSYIHQYVWKGAPRSLPMHVRVAVAKALDMPVDSLRPPGEPSLETMVSETLGGASKFGGDQPDVPIFRDDDVIDPARASQWTPGLNPGGNRGIYIALWITCTRGRLQPGDLAYVHMMQPPRIGDTAVALVERRVVALGTLMSMGSTVQIRDADDAIRELSPREIQLAKVIAVRFP